MAVAKNSDTRLEAVCRMVQFTGMADVMFDRYAGDNNTKLAWGEKIYLIPDTRILCLPTINLVSLLSSHNTNSAPKRLRDARQFKKICNACLSFTQISGLNHRQYIEFTRNGEAITVGNIGDSKDDESGLYLHRSVARLDKGIPNPKERPVLPTPWQLTFSLTVYPNKEIKEAEIKNLLEESGLAIGIGTYRGVFGKYQITQWE